MKSKNNDLTKISVQINRAIYDRDVEVLFSHMADYMRRAGMKATRTDLNKIPMDDTTSAKIIKLLKTNP